MHGMAVGSVCHAPTMAHQLPDLPERIAEQHVRGIQRSHRLTELLKAPGAYDDKPPALRSVILCKQMVNGRSSGDGQFKLLEQKSTTVRRHPVGQRSAGS